MNENNLEIPEFYKAPKIEYKKEIRLFNAGWVVYYDHYGNDVTPLVSARMSTGNPSGVDAKKDAGSRSFLWRKGHVSPFEQAGLSIIFQVPISTARQILRHKSLHVNEYSMRYSEPLFEYFIAPADEVCYDNEFNKQMSGQPVDPKIAEEFIGYGKELAEWTKQDYERFRKMGIAKERVRDFQTVNSYTRIMATANLRDWFFFLHKRLKPDAQYEVRKFAEAVYEILLDLFPLCCEEFDEHTLNAESMSKTDMVVIREWFKMLPHLSKASEEVFNRVCSNNGLNKTRTRELKQKLQFEFEA